MPVSRDLLKSFLQGYCAARAGKCRRTTGKDYGFFSEYEDGMMRSAEHFILEGGVLDESSLRSGEWVTFFGKQPDLFDESKFLHLANEYMMKADIAGLYRSDGDMDLTWLKSNDEIDIFNRSGVFPSFDPSEEAFLFAFKKDDAYVATARYGTAGKGFIVVDRVGTLDCYKRQGLASRLLAAIVAHASLRDIKTALLVSTVEGEPLYLKAGFEHVAQVKVFSVN
ncbi:GNAT family N-acetyltransferase [Mesorhizobium sp. SB112]|uniref:GNAT family N-acetyltransferase n=1 Tax=Mesorhizobium sp. SB112 TaxID=3151853 RepID=UPI003262FCF8